MQLSICPISVPSQPSFYHDPLWTSQGFLTAGDLVESNISHDHHMNGWLVYNLFGHLTTCVCSPWTYSLQCCRILILSKYISRYNVIITNRDDGKSNKNKTQVAMNRSCSVILFWQYSKVFHPQHSVCTALIRSNLTSLAVWHQLLADTQFTGNFLNNCCCLPQRKEFYHFVIDNKIPGFHTFDPPLLLLSQAAEMQPPNILVHSSARHGQNPTTGHCAAG